MLKEATWQKINRYSNLWSDEQKEASYSLE
jgi:hypothetical protein